MAAGSDEDVDLDLLRNCTVLAANKFPWATTVNDTSFIGTMNMTHVIDLISEMIDLYRERFLEDDYIKQHIQECLYPSPTIRYQLPWEQKTVWGVLFGAMLLIAISGNCIVMWIVLAHRRMRSVTNYYLLNLSVADLLMSSMNCIFNFIFLLNNDWPFGSLYCTLNNFIANLSVASSVFTLVAISMDRYIAIIKPLRHRPRNKAKFIIFCTWFLSGILSFPCLLYSKTRINRYSNGRTRTLCYMLWPDGRHPKSKLDYTYNIVFLGATYIVPVAVMLACYTLMGRELWGSRSIGEHTDQRQLEAMKSKRKLVRMFIVIVSIFAICWLPYHLFFIYAYHNNQVISADHVQTLYLAIYLLAMSNAMVNPCIYYWMNGRFRVYFQQIICCCCMRILKYRNRNISQGTRSKTVSVHWRQGTAETRFHNTTTSIRRGGGAHGHGQTGTANGSQLHNTPPLVHKDSVRGNKGTVARPQIESDKQEMALKQQELMSRTQSR